MTREQVINDVMLAAQPTKQFVRCGPRRGGRGFSLLGRRRLDHGREHVDRRRLDPPRENAACVTAANWPRRRQLRSLLPAAGVRFCARERVFNGLSFLFCNGRALEPKVGLHGLHSNYTKTNRLLFLPTGA